MSKKAIVLVHFGTSYPSAIEKALDPFLADADAKFPGIDIYEAYSSSFIRKALMRKHGIPKQSLMEVLEELAASSYDEVYVQPTVLMMGLEYEKISSVVNTYKTKFDKIKLCRPMIYTSDDYMKLIEALVFEYEITEDPEKAYVFMGHGSAHPSEAIYAALDHRFKHAGFSNVYVTAIEGYPDLDVILPDLRAQGPKEVIVMPLLIVAGEHAINDMVGPGDDSLKSRLLAEGYGVTAIVRGLGEISSVRTLIFEHILEEIN